MAAEYIRYLREHLALTLKLLHYLGMNVQILRCQPAPCKYIVERLAYIFKLFRRDRSIKGDGRISDYAGIRYQHRKRRIVAYGHQLQMSYCNRAEPWRHNHGYIIRSFAYGRGRRLEHRLRLHHPFVIIIACKAYLRCGELCHFQQAVHIHSERFVRRYPAR